MPEHFKVVYIPCKALYKCSALHLSISEYAEIPLRRTEVTAIVVRFVTLEN